jgi:hypothetical protein
MSENNQNKSENASTYNANYSAETTANLLRQRAYERRNAAQQLRGDGSARLCKCGRTPFTAVTLGMKGSKASYRGFTHCASVWACSVCSGRILHTRFEEISGAISKWEKRAGLFYTETLTLPHKKSDRLKNQLETFRLAQAAWNKDRSVRAMRERLGIVGYFKVLEVPRTLVNGWHPHYMYVFFAKRALSRQELAQWKQVSQSVWRRCLQSEGVTIVSSKAHYLGLVRNPQAIARYATKYSDKAPALAPGSQSEEFSPKVGTVSHWDILSSWMATNSNADKQLWLEWISAMKGRRFITWSKGLRESLGLNTSPEDKAIPQEDEHTPLVEIHKDSVAELVRLPKRQAEYLFLLPNIGLEPFLHVLRMDGIKYKLTEQGKQRLKEANTG